jgi:hypothetical protein
MIGSADASMLLRAQVALSGLLALPAKEAMYFTAKTDSAGRSLDGRCTYELTVPNIPARWWSVTAYEREGWLIRNPEGQYSASSGQFTQAAKKMIAVGPVPPVGPVPWTGGFISTGGVTGFDLTLRVYHPAADLLAHPETAKLPLIERAICP